MKILEWLMVLGMAVHCIAFFGVRAERDHAIQQLDAVRQETRQIAGMYNGLLIGRGCELSE